MSKIKDLTGQRFGKLVANKLHSMDDKQRAIWFCQCDCGKTYVGLGANLSAGSVASCGCSRGENTKMYRGDKLYSVWKGMRARCHNHNHKGFKRYGGRGIKVCERWNSFLNFREDMHSSYVDGLHIDRIDNDGNYESSNCRWVTPMVNARSTSRVKLTLDIAKEIRGSNFPHKKLSEIHNVSIHTIKAVKNNKIWV